MEYDPYHGYILHNGLKGDNNKFILVNGTNKHLECSPNEPAQTCGSFSNPPKSRVLFTPKQTEDGHMVIRNISDEGEMFLGVKYIEVACKEQVVLSREDDPDLRFKWKAIPVEQGYKWSTMNDNKLPENALCGGKTCGQ